MDGRNKKTIQKIHKKLKDLGVNFGNICVDNWEAFVAVFQEDNRKNGKKYTTDIEGNNTRLRHRIRRAVAVRKTCCFSQKSENHTKTFEVVFFHINFGYILCIIFCASLPNLKFKKSYKCLTPDGL